MTADPEAILVSHLAQAARGPRREGIYALWLTVRVAQDLLLEPPIPERAHRRRIAALGHRLSSLTVPAPLRRALIAAVAHLEDADPEAAALVLGQLVAPTREAASSEAASALAQAARAAKEILTRRR